MTEMICPHCGKQMVKHIIQDGARFHVTSWHGSANGALSHCSEKDCEENHGEGHCIPYSEETKRRMRELAYKKPHSTGTEFQEDYLR